MSRSFDFPNQHIVPEWLDAWVWEIIRNGLLQKHADFQSEVVEKLKNIYRSDDNEKIVTDYEENHLAYLAYYFMVNLFKIWTPLEDLYSFDCLPNFINVVDLGCGPGSASLGLIEFYKYLAIQNKDEEFNINIELIDNHDAFLEDAKILLKGVIGTFPKNLQISFTVEKANILHELQLPNDCYDLVILSNVLANEESGKTDDDAFFLVKKCLKCLNNLGSLIIIEPGDESAAMLLNRIKTMVYEQNLAKEVSWCEFMTKDNGHCSCWGLNRVYWQNTPGILRYLSECGIRHAGRNYIPFSYKIFSKGIQIQSLDLLKDLKRDHTPICNLNYNTKSINIICRICSVMSKFKKCDDRIRFRVCDGSSRGCGESCFVSIDRSLFDFEKLSGNEFFEFRNVDVFCRDSNKWISLNGESDVIKLN